MDSKQTKNIWIGVAVVVLVIGAYYFSTTQKSPTNLPIEQNTQNTASQKSEHIVSYISALNNVFYNLYRSTLEYNEIQKQYPTFSQDTLNKTAGLQLSKDLNNASFILKPFIEDKDESIKVSAGLLYLDISAYLKANDTVVELYRKVSPDNIQELQYGLASMVSAQKTLQDELMKNIFPVIKGIIQVPVEQPERVGLIRYSISKDQRLQLLDDINRIFGDSIKNSKDNYYLLAERVLQLTLTPDTYEEQKLLTL